MPRGTAGPPSRRVDHDALVRGAYIEAVSAVPADPDAVYRGWMLTSDSVRRNG